MLVVNNNPGVVNVINQALTPFLGEENVVLGGDLLEVVPSVSSFSPGGIPVVIPENVVISGQPSSTLPPSPHAASHISGSDQLANATPSVHGLMSAADKTTANVLFPNAATLNALASVQNAGALAPGGWLDAFALLIPTYAPGATQIREIPVLPAGVYGSPAVDAEMAGGGVSSSSGWVRFSNDVILTPKVGSWAVAFEAQIPVPASGKIGALGLANLPAGADAIVIEHDYDSGGVYTTHIAIKFFLASVIAVYAGPTIDGLRHTYILASDGTTLRLLIDGTVAWTNPISDANMSNVAMSAALVSLMPVSRVAVATTL